MRSTTAIASVTRATEPTAGGSVGEPWTSCAELSSAGAVTRSAAGLEQVEVAVLAGRAA